MRLIPPPNAWSCLPTSFAMAIGYPVEDLITLIGHDGSPIQWPQFPEPKCRRGFHHQECVSAVWNLGFATTQFEWCAGVTPPTSTPSRSGSSSAISPCSCRPPAVF